MTPEIKAIETVYRGYRFRSRLEARWAVVFDALGIRWQYEHEGYKLPSGKRYLPDFYLPDVDVLVEVKGKVEGAQRKEIVLWGHEIPAYMDHWGQQTYAIRPKRWFSREWAESKNVVNYMWLPDSRRVLSIGVQIGAIANSGREVYLSSPSEELIGPVAGNFADLGVKPSGIFYSDELRAGIEAFFPCAKEQEKLIEAGRSLGKTGVMLIGALHEFEAERFEPFPHPNSDVMRNGELRDLVELLSGQVGSQDEVEAALTAGMEARF